MYIWFTLWLMLEVFIAFHVLAAFTEYMTAPDFANILQQVLKMLFIW